MLRDEQNKFEDVLGEVESLYPSEEKNGAYGTMSTKAITVQMKRGGKRNIAMDVCADYMVDALIEEDSDRKSA